MVVIFLNIWRSTAQRDRDDSEKRPERAKKNLKSPPKEIPTRIETLGSDSTTSSSSDSSKTGSSREAPLPQGHDISQEGKSIQAISEYDRKFGSKPESEIMTDNVSSVASSKTDVLNTAIVASTISVPVSEKSSSVSVQETQHGKNENEKRDEESEVDAEADESNKNYKRLNIYDPEKELKQEPTTTTNPVDEDKELRNRLQYQNFLASKIDERNNQSFEINIWHTLLDMTVSILTELDDLNLGRLLEQKVKIVSAHLEAVNLRPARIIMLGNLSQSSSSAASFPIITSTQSLLNPKRDICRHLNYNRRGIDWVISIFVVF